MSETGDQSIRAYSESSSEQREQKVPPTSEATVICGMGPVDLKKSVTSARLYPNSPYMRRNAQAANLASVNGLTRRLIMSGFASGRKESDIPESTVLKDTAVRMMPTHLPPEDRVEKKQRAVSAEYLQEDPEATTTFGNIVHGLNKLDEQSPQGYFDGWIDVLSSQFHGPRIMEMLKGFGLDRGRFVSAEQTLAHFGYTNINPREVSGSPYEEWETKVYEGQPVSLQNLQDNPLYVIFELANVKSDRRLHAMMKSLEQYYRERDVQYLPPVCNGLPVKYDASYDYGQLRAGLAQLNLHTLPRIYELRKDESGHFINSEDAQRFTGLIRELVTYFDENTIKLPWFYEGLREIPQMLNQTFDYESLRRNLFKHEYRGALTPDEYRQLATMAAADTTNRLTALHPHPSRYHRERRQES